MGLLVWQVSLPVWRILRHAGARATCSNCTGILKRSWIEAVLMTTLLQDSGTQGGEMMLQVIEGTITNWV